MISRDEQWLDTCVHGLRRRRMPVLGLGSVAVAAMLAPQVRFAAIFCDVSDDRDWNGCRTLNASPGTADVPVIAVVAGDDPRRIAPLAGELGCSACVPKTASLAVVLEVLQCVCDVDMGSRVLPRLTT